MGNDATAHWYTDVVDVQTFTGTRPGGGRNTEPHLEVPCFIAEGTELVRDPRTGDEVVSSTTLYMGPDKRPWFTPTSVVTVRGAVTQVIDTEWFPEAQHGRMAGLVVKLR